MIFSLSMSNAIFGHFCVKKHVGWKGWLPAVWAFITDFRNFLIYDLRKTLAVFLVCLLPWGCAMSPAYV